MIAPRRYKLGMLCGYARLVCHVRALRIWNADQLVAPLLLSAYTLSGMKFCRPCFRPALSGCLALTRITATSGGRLQLTDGDAAAMASALLDVNVHGKAVKERQMCLELLIALYQVTPACYHALCTAKPAVIRHALCCHHPMG